MGMKVLFICTGNTCRSPMAEGLAKKILGPRVDVRSAGIAAWEGQPASEHAIGVMQTRDIDLSAHRARLLSPLVMKEADWIIPMTQEHEERLRALYPEVAAKIRRLGAWGNTGKDIKDIVDPFSGSRVIYEKCAAEIEAALWRVKEELDRLEKDG